MGGQYGFQCCRHLIQQHARTGQRRQNTTRNCVGAVKDRNLHKHTHFCRDTVFSALPAHQPTFYVRSLTEPQTKQGQKMSKYEMTFKHSFWLKPLQIIVIHIFYPILSATISKKQMPSVTGLFSHERTSMEWNLVKPTALQKPEDGSNYFSVCYVHENRIFVVTWVQIQPCPQAYGGRHWHCLPLILSCF